jgi:hypothetical protein
MKKFIVLLLVSILSLGFYGCNQDTTTIETTTANAVTTQDATTADTISTEKELELPSISDLANDEFAVGNYYGDSGISRIPLDPAYQMLIDRKEPLQVGETYTESFEGDFLSSKLYPYRTDDGAEFSLVAGAINDLSLVLNTSGNYAGVYLNGMKFSANSSYDISFDYRILTGTQEFFLQFRSLNGGVDSDVYRNISCDNNIVNHYSFQADLGNYNDYELMLFPRFDSGMIAIDNVEITRIDSKPMIEDYQISGDLLLNSELSVDYDFYDAEGHSEGDTIFNWYSALDEFGMNKELLATNTKNLSVNSDMLGKYIICDVQPISTGTGAINNIGNSVYVVSNKLPGSIVTQVEVNLDSNESFTEDFENDINVINNLFFEEFDGGRSYIQSNDSNKELYLSSGGSYGGIVFSGINLEMNKVYNISFDYRILEMPSNIYVQTRTQTGWLEHDKYYDINLQDKQLDTTYQFSGDFGLDGYDDYKLMIFFGNQTGNIVIDNIVIEDMDQVNYQVNSVELSVGEYIFEHFDSNTRSIGFDFAQVPNTSVTSDSSLAISGSSLYFESAGSYLCLFINQGLIYTPNATYRVSFEYKIVDFVDTIYFQFNGGAYGNAFTEFGSQEEVNSVNHFSSDFQLLDSNNYVIQIFPGESSGNTIVIIDNIKIERIN